MTVSLNISAKHLQADSLYVASLIWICWFCIYMRLRTASVVQLERSLRQCGQCVCASNEAGKTNRTIVFFPSFSYSVSLVTNQAQGSNVFVSFNILNGKLLIPCLTEKNWVIYLDVMNHTPIISPTDETSCFQ